jgi:phenylacetic acid degradation operon negative regulatory protein
MRTTSLIVTLFGDVVSQHGDTIWLSSLARCLQPLGVSERLVRTSVFRLVKEGWLESERVGRRSYYRFTPYGSHEYARAARRIYSLKAPPWDGRWQLLLPQDIGDENRERFRRSLHWQGYRSIAAGTFAKPGKAGPELAETLAEFDVQEQVIVMEAEMPAMTSRQTIRNLVHDNWHLEDVAQRYREFQRRYQPLFKWLAKQTEPAPEVAFVARTLLIHDYRRILLQDTPLPEPLLPPGWPGAESKRATGEAYLKLAAPSVAYITGELESGNGAMPPPVPLFWQRFAEPDNA